LCFASTNQKLAYFYFDFNDTNNHNVAVVIRSLIKQLSAGEPELDGEAQLLYARYSPSGHEPSFKELEDAILSLIDGLGKDVYIVLDALDEFPESSGYLSRLDLLDQIKNLVERGSDKLHVLVTSRKEQDIDSSLAHRVTEQVSIQSAQVDADIRLYISSTLRDDHKLKKVPEKYKKEIETKLVEGSRGM
jgi:hypothetical protein